MPVSGLECFAPRRETPVDFDALWATTLAELDAVPPRPQQRPAVADGAGRRLTRVRFASLGGARIEAYLLRAGVPVPRPLIVHAHGYNARFDVMERWARRGCDVFGFDARGFGRSADAAAPDPSGYVLTGIGSPYTSILRGAAADYVQAARVARRLVGHRMSRTVLYGFSFGGALALVAAALGEAAALVVTGQPTFGWTAERLRLAAAGSAAELRGCMDREPWRRDTIMHTLAYFDTMNFAPRITAPALVGIGLDDAVVPSRTVLAVVNQMTAPLELRLLPVSHSSDPRESLWTRFESEWLAYAVDGVPPRFGSRGRSIEALKDSA